MSTSGMYAKFLTKKNALTAAVRGTIPGMVASVSGVLAQARYQEKTTTIDSTSSIPPFRENAAFYLYNLLTYTAQQAEQYTHTVHRECDQWALEWARR